MSLTANVSTTHGIGVMRKRSPNEVDRRLEVEALLVHDDADHVVRVAAGLLNIVREDVLWSV
jgi:hypothetical protein